MGTSASTWSVGLLSDDTGQEKRVKEQKSVKERRERLERLGVCGRATTSNQANNLHTSETCATSNLAQPGLAARGGGGGAPRTGCEGRQVIGRGPGDEEVGEGVFPVGSRTEVRARNAVKGSD